MSDSNRLFVQGNPNPEKFGRSIRFLAGNPPDPSKITAVAAFLGRTSVLIDSDGYECEIIAAATNSTGKIAYVETRVKDTGFHPHGAYQRNFDVTIRIHQVTQPNLHSFAEIESYNPFFGCDVRYFEWLNETAILIYREKHWTFACRFGDVWPPKFVKIEDRWTICNDVLTYVGYKENKIRRLSFPLLEELKPISIQEAETLGQMPFDQKST
ncbi:MAG: hypothetical protein K1Y36_30180 [Blastocatellia bacterium]|nr:hypothetical protein [Blastocatellia bacterium]